MKIFVTGATGFLGARLVPALLEAGHEIQALVRLGSERKLADAVRKNPNFVIHTGDAANPATLAGAAAGCETFINLIGTFEEDGEATLDKVNNHLTRVIVELARRVEAKRFIHLSALGARDMADSEFHRSNYKGESIVKMSGLTWTILRPSIMWGPGDWFIRFHSGMIHSFGPVIVPDGGRAEVQPVHVDDVAQAIVKIVAEENPTKRIIEIAGPERVTLRRVIEMIAEAKYVTPFIPLNLPTMLVKPVLAAIQSVFGGFPGNRDLLVAMRDNVASAPPDSLKKEFQIEPKGLTVEALRAYVG